MTTEDRRSDSDTDSASDRDSSSQHKHHQQPDESGASDEPSDERADRTPTEATTAGDDLESADVRPGSQSSCSTDSSKPAGPDRLSEPARQTDSADPTDTARSSESDGSHASAEPLWRRFLYATDGPLLLLREVCLSLVIVLLIGGILFGISGVWPPMVAVESESMEPNINQYDLVFVTEPDRFSPAQADRLGVVTADTVDETEYTSFNSAGSVVVFDNPESSGPPIIHRAHFFVEEGENWYDRANTDYVSASDCDELQHCPAPHDGYITKGDNDVSNAQYDQANGIAPVVKPEWVTGIAQLRVPYAGYIRLALTGAASSNPLLLVGLTAVGTSGAYAIGRRELLS